MLDAEAVIKKIVEKTELSEEEVTEKVKAKVEEFSGLITAATAAVLVAKELGVDVEVEQPRVKSELTVKDLFPDLNSVNISLRVIRCFRVREFGEGKNAGRVASCIAGDSTGVIRVVLWRNHAELAERLKHGDMIRITRGYTRLNNRGELELHAGKNTVIEVNPEDVEISDVKAPLCTVEGAKDSEEYFSLRGRIFRAEDTVVIADETGVAVLSLPPWAEPPEDGVAVLVPVASAGRNSTIIAHTEPVPVGRDIKVNEREVEKFLARLKPKRKLVAEVQEEGEFVEVRGTVVEVYTPRFFTTDKGESIVVAAAIDDGTASLRATFFGEKAEKLLGRGFEEIAELTDDESALKAIVRPLRGRELVIQGRVGRNPNTKALEVAVRSFRDVDPAEELKMLIAMKERFRAEVGV